MKLYKNRQWISFICLTILLISSCTSKETKSSYNLQIITKDNLAIGEITDTTPEFIFRSIFPILKDQYSSEICNEINDSIKKFVLNQKAEFNIGAWKVCKRDYTMSPYLSTYDMNYEIISLSEKYFSVRLTTYIDWSYSKTPSLYYYTLNYDISKEKIIEIIDLANEYFSSPDDAIEYIRTQCLENIYNEDEIECKSFWKSEKEMDVFQFFNMTDSGVSFIFDDYILDSHSCGNPELYISYDMLKENGNFAE